MNELNPAAASEDGARVLIVDDNRIVARALGLLLNDAGYQTAIFNSGAAALDYAANHALDAAVIDIHLPDISGLVLTQRLRQAWGPDRPIIIVSGDASMENLNSLPHVGATYFFRKPVRSSQLLARLRELVA